MNPPLPFLIHVLTPTYIHSGTDDILQVLFMFDSTHNNILCAHGFIIFTAVYVFGCLSRGMNVIPIPNIIKWSTIIFCFFKTDCLMWRSLNSSSAGLTAFLGVMLSCLNSVFCV